ncbi:MAG: hypothetical protein ACTHLX_12800 [Candidatus Binatia bacterium]
MDTVKVAYRDDDRTPVIYCIKEIGAKYYGIGVEVLKIKPYSEFEASLFNDSADVLVDHVEFLYAEATKGKKITFFCAPRIVRGLDLMVPNHVESVSDFIGKNMAVRDSGRPHTVTLWLRMMGLEGKVGVPIFKDADVGRWGQWKKVISGECIACFMDPLYQAEPLKAGLKFLPVPDLPVVSHYAQACTAEFARQKSTVLKNYLKSVIHGICWMKHRKQEALEVVSKEPMRRMEISDAHEMEKHFDAIVSKLQIKPYPTLDALSATYEIACEEYGAKWLNPLALWDMHWVKELDDEGFIDALIREMT